MFLQRINHSQFRSSTRHRPLGYVTSLSSSLLLLGILSYDGVSRAVQAVSFNFSAPPDTPAEILTGFSTAGDLWSSVLQDDVTINVDISFADLEAGVLGRTIAHEQSFAYNSVRDVLWSDRTSFVDEQATQQIPQGSTFDLLINYTSDSPFGSGSATPYLDNDGSSNNQTIRMTQANAKALGLINANSTLLDASILMSQQTLWDFDRSDGIAPAAFDFMSVATHELGHVLGFVSGTDLLDTSSPLRVGDQTFFLPEDFFAAVSPLDLFRFSDESVAAGDQIIDWTASPSAKFFSLDGGQTSLAPFATGIVHGEGQSNSHWAKDQTNGIMDPDIRAGEQLAISNLDLVALDAIGWDMLNPEVSFDLFPDPPDPLILVGADESIVEPATVSAEGLAPVGLAPIDPVLTLPAGATLIEPAIEVTGAAGQTDYRWATATQGEQLEDMVAAAWPLLPLTPETALDLKQHSAPSRSYLTMTQAVPDRSSWLPLVAVGGVLGFRKLRRRS